ncbi:unnamed protein product [Adineta ricciae]|uniref:C2H2-type domain-containing protein n=1 Tax=Adineta ricciae TaxID=249248 RepID=A0A815W4C8_ADIRI|nr:unnamed protein product [Adineta ricciae]
MTGRKTIEYRLKPVGKKSVRSFKKVHNRLIFVRNHYETSDEDESSTIEVSQSVQSADIEQEQKLSGINIENEPMPIEIYSDENQGLIGDVAPGTTQSSITILASHDKSTSMSPTQTMPAVEDDSSDSFSSLVCSNKSQCIHSCRALCARTFRENVKLKKDIEYYKLHWMPKPAGSQMESFTKPSETEKIDTCLSTTKAIEKELEIQRKVEKICHRLKITKKQLKKCKDPVDITKTCREIVKCIYPETEIQTKMALSKMSSEQKFDIIGNFNNNYEKSN